VGVPFPPFLLRDRGRVPPFNRHFIHDIGSFQIGLGAVLLLALKWRDALLVTLAGVSIGSAVHVLSHVLDRHIGGNPSSDIPLLSVLTLLLAAGVVARNPNVTRDDDGRPAPRS